MLKWWGRRGRHVGDTNCQSAPHTHNTHRPHTTAVDATGTDSTESARAIRSIDDSKPLVSPLRDDGPRLFSLLRRHNNNVGINGDNSDLKLLKQMDKMDAGDSDKPEALTKGRNMQKDATAINSEVPTSGSGNIDDNAMKRTDEMKYLLPHNEPLGTEDTITILWKRRRQRENIRKLKSLVGGGNATSLSGDLPSDTFTLSRALELESTLQQSSTMNDHTMIPMHVMLAKEKAMEDYLYDIWDQNMNMLAAEMVDEEPEFGYDNKGVYEQLTTCEDGEGDLES